MFILRELEVASQCPPKVGSRLKICTGDFLAVR